MKILKVLKSNKYHKDMKAFKAPEYPVDYDLYITKRRDIYILEEKLQNRLYTNFKEVVEDLRLIFLNGLNYNKHFREVNPINNLVYEAAERMLPILDGKLNQLR